MARKPKYSKEDFVKEAVNKMLDKYNTNYDTVVEYPLFYNGVWYPGKEVYEFDGQKLTMKPENPMTQQINRDKENLSKWYENTKDGLDENQLTELTKEYNDKLTQLHPWQWFEFYTWTQQEQDEFKQWFVDECRKRFRMTKKHSEQEASMWLLGYGLRTVDNK